MKTITIKSKGKISIQPDTIELNFKLSHENKEYDQTLLETTEKYNTLLSKLVHIGFTKESLKTLDFNIRTNYEDHHENGNYKRVFVGYICTQILKLSFDIDYHKLAQILEAISKSKTNPEISFNFTVKNKEVYADKALKDAAKKAFKTAKSLALASNVTLGEVVSINHAIEDHRFISDTKVQMHKNYVLSSSIELDLNVEDIKIEELVEFTFEIK
ncbi:conserved hypothetical protein (DUF541) [Alteracholeplasma palmae J233]|uniref:SIMPL domain-containing protein n=1 Tax=Alteracholeplasma palmae (strain ATCC 49389 / J233) TaxID=1318466 RepID=U4KQU8_ALTPJ|nr:SIMPL domain-containing protein [Alteracholeplasma palmae]CCV63616.1 conserved hypothetical protein (DUF541) [Alteracholeplasma palmae J233]